MILAIDPGSSSGSYTSYNQVQVLVANLPKTPLDLLRLLQTFPEDTHVILENVGGSRPGNSAKSARTFATHLGHLEMALLACNFSTIKVTPRKWMDAVALGRPKGTEGNAVTLRKGYIYDQMQRRWPSVKFTKRQADSLGILTWYLDLAKK